LFMMERSSSARSAIPARLFDGISSRLPPRQNGAAARSRRKDRSANDATDEVRAELRTVRSEFAQLWLIDSAVNTQRDSATLLN
jgi:hypothetical protein